MTSPEIGAVVTSKLDSIKVESLFLLHDQEDKKRLCSQGEFTAKHAFLNKEIAMTFWVLIFLRAIADAILYARNNYMDGKRSLLEVLRK